MSKGNNFSLNSPVSGITFDNSSNRIDKILANIAACLQKSQGGNPTSSAGRLTRENLVSVPTLTGASLIKRNSL
jgi:hypothetical protein